MNVLVVYVHPNPHSFCAAIRNAAIAALEEDGHSVRLTDLHADKFQPVMTELEFACYNDAEKNVAGAEAYVADLRWAEAIIMIYPTWWRGLPAILKGWLERVWLPGVAFGLAGKGKPAGGTLSNVRIFGAIATYGSPWWRVKLYGDLGRKTLLWGAKIVALRRCRSFWLGCYDMHRNSDADRKIFLLSVKSRIRKIFR